MGYLVSIGLLVLAAVWAAAVYKRLSRLRGQMVEAWAHWMRATRLRNACVEDFAAAVSVALPEGDMLPRSLRRLAADSRMALARAAAGRHCAAAMRAAHAECELHRVLRRLEPTLKTLGAQPSNEHLLFLGTQVNISLFHQNRHARTFNLAAVDYNAELHKPSGRILAHLLGFDEATSLNEIPE